MNDSYNHNASTFPLLKLPGEIREQIFRHLVGDKLLHMKFDDGTLDSIPAGACYTRFAAVETMATSPSGISNGA